MSNVDTVKEQLSNLISSGEFNNKSSEELSDILYNLSLALATNGKGLKNCIGIKTLSQEEYNKYIINGTCDGSISKKNDKTWNPNIKKFGYHLVWYYNQQSIAGFAKVLNSVEPNIGWQIGYDTGDYTLRTHRQEGGGSTSDTYNVEIAANNSKAQNKLVSVLEYCVLCCSESPYNVGNAAVSSYAHIVNASTLKYRVQDCFIEKNSISKQVISGQAIYAFDWGTLRTSWYLTLTTSWRPCFVVVDNNKSSGSYY